ncbi:MAG: type IX secretion system membrane protein PorP/SprF [Bacteroidales bacterium]
MSHFKIIEKLRPMKAKYTISLLVLIITFQGLFGQDQNYSQWFNNTLYYNPAYAGLYDGVRTHFNYRNQWTNLPYDFNSYNVAIDKQSEPGQGVSGLFFTITMKGKEW